MTTHAAILEQLDRYDIGQFVPKDGPCILMHNGTQYHWSSPHPEEGGWETECNAHAHIERAAFRAVGHWCVKQDGSMDIDERPHEGKGPGELFVLAICKFSNNEWRHSQIASGPDEPAMWLAAMKYINGGRG